jgi:hydroxymethylglutaryl-CoA lyase
MNLQNQIEITETPRDAMQGRADFIPTVMKVKYINALLKTGFHTVDSGSFVSPKSVPQMADTAEVIKMLDIGNTSSNLMVVVGNAKGGYIAAAEKKVHTIAFPYSVSPTFLKRNLNASPESAWTTILDLKNICEDSGKKFRVYVTMAFGNPYGDAFGDEMVLNDVEKLCTLGITDLAFSDITGEGTPESIERLCSSLAGTFPDIKQGIHLHTKPDGWLNKVEAAWNAGIRRFESALGGYGGCSMTGYELLANLDTLELVNWCNRKEIPTGLNEDALSEAQRIATEVFI